MKPSRSPPAPASDEDCDIDRHLREFRPIRSWVLEALIDWLPFAILPAVLGAWLVMRVPLGLSYDSWGAQMFLTGLVAAAIAIFLLGYLLDRVRDTLDTLWYRDVLALPEKSMPRGVRRKAGRGPGGSALLRLADRLRLGSRIASDDPRDLECRYAAYIHDFEDRLNAKAGGWGLGLLFAIIEAGALRAGDFGGYYPGLTRSLAAADPGAIFYYVAPVLLAFLIGFLAWRLLVIGWQVAFFGRVFGFRLQMRHPDKSGGLNPLGDLSAMIAVVLAVPAIYLSGWIVLLPDVYGGERSGYMLYFTYMLLVTVVFSIVAFVVPVFMVHRDMVVYGADDRRRLDGVSRQVERECEDLQALIVAGPAIPAPPNPADETRGGPVPCSGRDVGPARGVDEATLKARTERIATLQEFAGDCTVPEWPFNRQVALKFVIPQILPWLTLLGVSEGLKGIIGPALGALPV